ncbi:MAG: dihydrolipoyl dehydrogenase [Acidimicrobiia bacterium]
MRGFGVYDVVIIGGGPGGYAAALYAHNFGLSVALVEKERVGGTCLIRGCIPAKTWLHAAEVFTTVAGAADYGVHASEPTFDWSEGWARKNRVVDQLVSGLSGMLKHRKVEIVDGYGRVAGPGKVAVDTPDGTVELEASNIIVATGSVPRAIPGYEFDGDRILSSDHALDWQEDPGRVAVVGAGAIGCEFASMLTDLGNEVHLFEMLDQIIPGADPQAVRALNRQLSARGVNIRTGVTVGAPEVVDGVVSVPFGDESVEVDAVLVAVGRAPRTGDLGLEGTAVELDGGYVLVNPDTYETAEPGVYAVGDIVAGTPQLAHAGFAEAIAAITYIATGEPAPVNYRAIPLVVYTHPEMASVGLTQEQAEELGYEVDKTTHTIAGVGRAIIRGRAQGLVKVISEKNGPILGATVVGPEAGEMIHELMYAVGWEALPSEAAAFVHAHPTLSEAVGETLLAAAGRPLH